MKNSHKSIIDNHSYRIVLGIILFILSFDFLSKMYKVYDLNGFTRYSAIPKLILEIVLIFYLLRYKKHDLKGIIYGLILIAIVSINIFISQEELTSQFISQKVYILNKFIYFFLFAEVLLDINKKTRKLILTSIQRVLIYIGVINGLFMILGVFTNFEILRAYPNTARFGYNGFLLYTSETSYFYILLIITTYYEYLHKETKGFHCIFFIIVSLLLGTKAVWLFLLLLGVIHLSFHRRKVIRVISIVGFFLGLIITFVYNKYFVKSIISLFSHGPDLYAKHGFITVLTSTRDLLLINAFKHIEEEWTTINYLLGGINFFKYEVEFEFVDIFLFFGIIGFVVYLYFLRRIFFSTFYGKYKILLFIALMLVAAFAGNLFMSIMCSIFAFTVFQNMEYLHESKQL